jgi:hypothetical protein
VRGTYVALGPCSRLRTDAYDKKVVTRKRMAILTLSIVCTSVGARAQLVGAGSTQDSVTDPHASAATYVLPDDDDYVQPTVAVDRGKLHLEGRYNYEARRWGSGFIGRCPAYAGDDPQVRCKGRSAPGSERAVD